MSKATADLQKDEEGRAPTLATPRLILRSWTESDTAPYTEICQDPQVMRFINSGRALTNAEVADRLSRYEQFWRTHGYGAFAVVEQSTNDFIGFCGLSLPTYAPEIMPAVEIGWRLSSAHWGKGFGLEAVTAILDWGFTTHDFDAIVALVHPDNFTGAKIANRTSMTREQQTKITPRFSVDVYRITQASWEMAGRA